MSQGRSFGGAVVLACVMGAASAGAQQGSDPAADPPPVVTGALSNVTRVESWRYFAPPPALGVDRSYLFAANRAELAVRVKGARVDLGGAFNYVRLDNLPAAASGPGLLGAGAHYFAATGVRYSYQLYLSEASLRVKSSSGGWSVTIGRTRYASGEEASMGNSTIDRVVGERVGARLVGDFEWSLYQRRFDGVRLDVDRPAWHLTTAALVPTQGGFEESANLSMPKLQLAAAAFTRRTGGSRRTGQWQAFGYLYRDRRLVTSQPDNTGRMLDGPAAADVTMVAVGGAHVSVRPVRTGEIDTVVWGAGELGTWYGQPHRAASVAAEAGHRWTRAPLAPWLRAGYLWASGDADATDNRHGTFFQMLPSSRRYALSSTYAQMNVRDLFARLALAPGRARVGAEAHRLTLASGADLWYQGSGATAASGGDFGFSGLPGGGAASLGTVVDATVEWPIGRHWSLGAYAGRMWGGTVVGRWFAGHRLTHWAVESAWRF